VPLYRLLSALALLLYAPWALLRSIAGKRRLGDVRGRLGRAAYPDADGGVWIHAVSVGEVGVARNLLAALSRRHPDRRLVLSVTTAAGRELAGRVAGPSVPVFAFPFDLAGPVERSLDAVRPGLVLLTETEIWPLFLERAAARGIPVALVNGRISTRSFRRYSFVRAALSASLARIGLFAMQSPADADRIRSLGAPADRVRATGNVKYDLPEAGAFSDAVRLRAAAAGRPVLVAASTAEGEEAIVLEVWGGLPSPRPLLALAPRRPERFDAAASLVQKSGRSLVRRSSTDPVPAPADVYLLDSIGELASLYREARLAFIGGSFASVGGHNPIEAWAAGVPAVVGPHTENFADIVADGAARGFLRKVATPAALREELARALSDAAATAETGARARRFVEENRGAAARTIELLSPWLDAGRKRQAAP
jgi:3-deoxy-D-manno-octulosonic-acid transferase